MLQPVAVGQKTLADYTHIVGRPLIEEIRELAEPLKGTRVVHLSATAFGGGVAEILYTLIPLMKDVGLEVEQTLGAAMADPAIADSDPLVSAARLFQAVETSLRVPACTRPTAPSECETSPDACLMRSGEGLPTCQLLVPQQQGLPTIDVSVHALMANAFGARATVRVFPSTRLGERRPGSRERFAFADGTS